MQVKQFALVAAFVVMTTSVTLTQSPDFSGMWTLDKNASDFTAPAFSGGRGGANIGRLFITHAANGTLIIGPETNGLKAWSYTPGQELSVPVGRDTTMMVRSKWDGDRVVAEGTQGNMQMHEIMSLSPDAQTLTFEIRTTTPDGEVVNRLVYTKDQPVGRCEDWAMPCKEFPQHVAKP